MDELEQAGLVGGRIGEVKEGGAAESNGLAALAAEDFEDVGEGPAPLRRCHGAGLEFVALPV